jgi:hypothetical protein
MLGLLSHFRSGCAAIWGTIEVGTAPDRVTGKPRFRMLLATGAAHDWKGFDSADNLSELPRLIAKLRQY